MSIGTYPIIDKPSGCMPALKDWIMSRMRQEKLDQSPQPEMQWLVLGVSLGAGVGVAIGAAFDAKSQRS